MENQILTELMEKYKLTEEEHRTVFDFLKQDLFANRSSLKNPSVVFVIGQPGCGKSTFIQRTDFSQYLSVSSDAYRHVSKYSKEILEKYPTNYAKLTNYDAHLWGDELFAYATQNGYSVLREKAPTNDSLLEVINAIPKNYEVVINVVVTGNLSSLLRTRERYEKEILESNTAKLSSIEAHNKCYDLLPDFLSKCFSLGVTVNYIVTVDGEFQMIPVGDDYLDVLQKLREENNEQTCLQYESRMNDIKTKMIRRNAPQEQFDELKKIEDVYLKITNSSFGEKIYKMG